MAALERELAAFNTKLPTMLQQAGKYALVHGDDLVGTFDTYEDALKQGYEKFALDPFLVKQISPASQIAYFSRDFGATCQA